MGYYVDRLSKVMQANLGAFTFDSAELTAAAAQLDSSARKLQGIMQLDSMFGGNTDVAIRSSFDKLSNYIDMLQETALQGSSITDELQAHMETAQSEYQHLPSGGVNFWEYAYGKLPVVWSPETGITSGSSFLEGLRARREEERERQAQEALRRLRSGMDRSSLEIPEVLREKLLLDGPYDASSSPYFTDRSGVPSGQPMVYSPSTKVPPASEWPIKVYRPGEMSQDGPLDNGYSLPLDPRDGAAPRDPVIRDLAEQEMRRQVAGGTLLAGAGAGALGLGAAALGGRGGAALVPNAALPMMPAAGVPAAAAGGMAPRAGGMGMIPAAGGMAGGAAAGAAARGGRGIGFGGGAGASGAGASRSVNAPGGRGMGAGGGVRGVGGVGAGAGGMSAGSGAGAGAGSNAAAGAGAGRGVGAAGAAGAGAGRGGMGMVPMAGAAGATGGAKGRDKRDTRRRSNYGASGVEFYDAPAQVDVGAAGDAGAVTDRVIEVAAPEGDRW